MAEFIDAVDLVLENTAKEMGYTALRDKPEKEAVFLGKDVFVSVFSDSPDSTRSRCVSRLCLLDRIFSWRAIA